MKIIRRADKIVYRFKCANCQSEFEITEAEREQIINDLLPDVVIDATQYFDCPVCDKRTRMNEIHKYITFEDGEEIRLF